jgi:hypothetical protein
MPGAFSRRRGTGWSLRFNRPHRVSRRIRRLDRGRWPQHDAHRCPPGGVGYSNAERSIADDKRLHFLEVANQTLTANIIFNSTHDDDATEVPLPFTFNWWEGLRYGGVGSACHLR